MKKGEQIKRHPSNSGGSKAGRNIMKSFTLKTAVAIIMLFGGAMPAFSLETAQEPATKIEFPVATSVRYQGEEHVLTLTGLTVRRKYFFKIYAIAHYMESGPKNSPPETIDAVLTDGKAK
ncbi:MAG: hypothetical protein Q8Q97_01005, partial [bacterium]|nr:hypothetical protein [bacterium]